jgi:hypothetical protein
MCRQCPWVHERIDATSLDIVTVDSEECVHIARQSKRKNEGG